MPTTKGFKTRFCEFVGVDDAKVDMFISDAVIQLNEAYWGAKYELGIYFLAAHYLALDQQTASKKTKSNFPLSGKSVDGVSVNYSTPSFDDGTEAYYNTTSYGQRYLSLRKTLGVPAFSI